ncbi:hypothetical protein UlMin_028736 [Ulmus minor]
MKQKIVVRVQMSCNKCRKKALKIAAMEDGVSSVEIGGEDKDRLVVTGDGVDPVCLTSSLRKKVGSATLLSVEELKETKKEEIKAVQVDSVCLTSSQCVSSNYCPQYYCPQPVYQAVHHYPYPDPSCSIM